MEALGQKYKHVDSTANMQLIASNYVKVNGSQVTLDTFTAMNFENSESIRLDNVTVENMDQLINVLQVRLDMKAYDNVQVFFNGNEVSDLNAFCQYVTNFSGNTNFVVTAILSEPSITQFKQDRPGNRRSPCIVQ